MMAFEGFAHRFLNVGKIWRMTQTGRKMLTEGWGNLVSLLQVSTRPGNVSIAFFYKVTE